jgi:recombination protein RecA
MTRTIPPKLSNQIRRTVFNNVAKVAEEKSYEGNFEKTISTGSTLLDLAISGGRKSGGGLPGGILVEVFGPPSCGKTVILCEIAGGIQRECGSIMFYDPESRLNKDFARLFGFNVNDIQYSRPDTVPEVFRPIREWNVSPATVNGVFADSLAALSTDMEMEDEDKIGMRRAKEFSEQLRVTARTLVNSNILMVCSNQQRENLEAGKFEPKFHTPGGQAIPYYASLRLRCYNPKKIKKTRKLSSGAEIERVIGVETRIEVVKSSVWKPFGEATVPILFDYGIDDIRANLQFIKETLKEKSYTLGGSRISNSHDHACQIIESDGKEELLREEVIAVWEEIESNFKQERKPKHE